MVKSEAHKPVFCTQCNHDSRAHHLEEAYFDLSAEMLKWKFSCDGMYMTAMGITHCRCFNFEWPHVKTP